MSESHPSLSVFGQALAKATRLRQHNFDTSTKQWSEAYKFNAQLFFQLQNTIQRKPDVLIVGAGRQNGIEFVRRQTKGWLYSGVHWSNFNPDLNVDIVVSTHAAPLEACLHVKEEQPRLLIHGVYSKVPPCLHRSCTLRWSDPFMLKDWKGKPTVDQIETLMAMKAVGVAPYLPAVRNTLFLNAMIMLWLGAKRIVFTGVDPHNPEYFFTGIPDLTLKIVRCLSACDPWLAEWDGRNERISEKKRSTAHRVQTFINSLLRERSAVGGKEYLIEFDRGFQLLSKLAAKRDVELGYIGESSYMKTTGLTRIG